MNELEIELLNLERPTRIRARLADLTDDEATLFRAVLGDLHAAVKRRGGGILAVVEELLSICVEDANRRACVEHAEVRELQRLADLSAG